MTPPAFVLSAGRTGTVFLTRTLPAHVPEIYAVHEPPGSRSLLMQANVAAWLRRGEGATHARLLRAVERRRAACPPGRRYVEINPMLCPLAPALVEIVAPLTLVHIVRHPVSWTRSIRAFRASGWRRYLIDRVPFANPAPVPRPEGWLGLDPVQQALWRWRACNEAIETASAEAERSVRLRYEDLFLADVPTRTQALRTLLDALELPAPVSWTPLLDAPRANRAPEARTLPVSPLAVARITGALMERYGYSLT